MAFRILLQRIIASDALLHPGRTTRGRLPSDHAWVSLRGLRPALAVGIDGTRRRPLPTTVLVWPVVSLGAETTMAGGLGIETFSASSAAALVDATGAVDTSKAVFYYPPQLR